VSKEGGVVEIKVFKQWLDALGHAWEGRDPDAAARLFTENATYQETPFEEPMRGQAAIRAYWEEVPRGQDQVKFACEVLAFDGQGEGIAHWRASFARVPSGVRVELDGILVVQLDESGLCTEFREWWHRREEGPAAAR
jgi:limonene-1,2-epoxide hydrolase